MSSLFLLLSCGVSESLVDDVKLALFSKPRALVVTGSAVLAILPLGVEVMYGAVL